MYCGLSTRVGGLPEYDLSGGVGGFRAALFSKHPLLEIIKSETLNNDEPAINSQVHEYPSMYLTGFN
jgi:hypothetical protein